MEKTNRLYLKKIRYAFQWGLFVFILYGGYKFYLFVEHFSSGTPFVKRPPLVDGFLPIGALMAFKLWVTRGIFDSIHPAALVIFIAAIVTSLTLKKSFCGWVCPIGTLSETVFKAGKKLFGRNFKIPKYIDYPMRSAKYILMTFFLYIILIKMTGNDIVVFLNTPYWKIADVKMLKFFTEMTSLTFFTLTALFILSLLFKNFWCRYLCPYGALTGIVSLLSPLKITRNEKACIHCMACTKNCPSLLPVEEKTRIKSPECTGCLTCVSNCPAKGALDVATPNKKAIHPLIYVLMVLIVFFGIIGAGKLAGKWHSQVTYSEYKALVPIVSQFEHP
jgi:polyferredoxin